MEELNNVTPENKLRQVGRRQGQVQCESHNDMFIGTDLLLDLVTGV